MCTIFAGKEESTGIVAKNYDCFVEGGMVFTNRRNMKKKSLVIPPEKEFLWTSKYGSVTFSQSGKGMPVCGINEKGLIVEQATMFETKYPEKDERAEISCLETIQYLLDTSVTVEEAVENFKNFRISNNSAKIHYFLMDKNRNKVIIEFLNGKMNCISVNKKIPIITNHSCKNIYLEKETYNSEYEKNSFMRFKIVKSELQKLDNLTLNRAFEILEKTKRKDSIWSIVYDLNKNQIYFKYLTEEKKIINLNDIDYGEKAESYLYDMESEKDFYWQPYCREMNRKNIERFYEDQRVLQTLKLSDSKFVIDAIDYHITQIEEKNIMSNKAE